MIKMGRLHTKINNIIDLINKDSIGKAKKELELHLRNSKESKDDILLEEMSAELSNIITMQELALSDLGLKRPTTAKKYLDSALKNLDYFKLNLKKLAKDEKVKIE